MTTTDVQQMIGVGGPGRVMAASTLVAVPAIVFFLFVQGRMTSGLVSGAVKG